MLNLVHLRTLLAVLETGSLSGAGRKLGYTTSAVSQQIAALERSLDVKLFERGPRNVWPTHASEQVGRLAAKMLSQLDEFEQAMGQVAGADRGRLRLCAFSTAGAQLLPRALARLVTRFSQAEFSLQEEGRSAAVADAVQASRSDLGLVCEYEGVPESWPAELAVYPILDEEVVVLAGRLREHPLPAVVRLTELANETWVANRIESAGRENLELWCTQAGFEPRVAYETDDFDVMRGIVRGNLGIALVPALALGTDGSITMHRIEGVRPRRKVRVVHRAADPNPLLVEAIDAIALAASEFATWTTTAFQSNPNRAPVARTVTARRQGRESRRASRTVTAMRRRTLREPT